MENTLQVYAAMALTAEEQQQISLELDILSMLKKIAAKALTNWFLNVLQL